MKDIPIGPEGIIGGRYRGPSDVFRNPNVLTRHARSLIAYAVLHSLRNGEYPTRKLVAQALNIPVDSVVYYEQELREHGVNFSLRSGD